MILNFGLKVVLSYIGFVSEENISSNIHALTALILQHIGWLLPSRSCWAFSTGFDTGTNHGDSFINIRRRIFDGGYIRNLHLLFVPLTTTHTSEDMASSIIEVLQAIFRNNCMYKLLGLSTDGAASMVGRVSSAMTRMESLLKRNVYRIWCVAH